MKNLIYWDKIVGIIKYAKKYFLIKGLCFRDPKNLLVFFFQEGSIFLIVYFVWNFWFILNHFFSLYFSPVREVNLSRVEGLRNFPSSREILEKVRITPMGYFRLLQQFLPSHLESISYFLFLIYSHIIVWLVGLFNTTIRQYNNTTVNLYDTTSSLYWVHKTSVLHCNRWLVRWICNDIIRCFCRFIFLSLFESVGK